ncbi:MAG TPA: extracellular solute-binding protein [Dermatophilaceae bacterium]
MTDDSSRPSRGMSRRAFLGRSAAAAVAFPTMAAFLDACSKAASTATAVPSFANASPAHPKTWDIPADNKAIASGLAPEKNATINIYTYTDYIDPAALKSFEAKYKQYNVKCNVTTFEDTTEAITKINAGTVKADIYNPSYDQMFKMVTAKLIAPLNHSYIPNIANVWPTFTNPWYDQEWRYTTPYTVYTTGVSWRTDKVKTDIPSLPNPWDVMWDPTYTKQTSMLDDYRTAMGLVCMRNKISLNTTSAKDLQTISDQLTAMNKTMGPKVNVTDYQDLPTGAVTLCQAWSGDVVNMLSYLPEGTSGDILRYWVPTDGTGPIDNDLLVLLKMSQNPVMAHLFLDHMMDYNVAMGNFSAIGYQPPQTKITPETLVSDGTIPKNLASCVVLEAQFKTGANILELSPADDANWQKVWQKFKAGA